MPSTSNAGRSSGAIGTRFYQVFGAMLVLLGIFALVHPQFSYKMEQHEVQLGNTRAVMETRRVFRVPRLASGLLAALGIGVAIAGTKNI